MELKSPALSAKRLFDNSTWYTLVLLGFTWGFVLVLDAGEVVDSLVILFAVLWLGHLGAAALSGRSRWWLHGSAAVAGFALMALFTSTLPETAYPPSTVEWVPFRKGAVFGWEAFGAFLSVALSPGLALKPPARYAQLTRAGMIAVVALSYFVIPESWVPRPGLGRSMIVIILVLVMVGVADTVIAAVDRRGRGALVGAAAVPIVSLALLVVAAGVFWLLVLGGRVSDINLQPPEPRDALALGTLAAVVLGALIISAFAIPRIMRPIDHPVRQSTKT